MKPSFLNVTPDGGVEVLKGLASPVRMRILQLLHKSGKMNVNEISKVLSLPQSTVATNIQMLEEAGLVSRRPAEGDRRRILLTLTPKAEGVLSSLTAAHLQELRRLEPALRTILARLRDAATAA